MARCSSPEIIILRAVIHSWNFADLDLYIGGETGKLRNLGFRQCKTIIMPLIPICYPSSLSLVVGVAFVVLSDVPSALRFLVDVFSFVVHAEFEVGILQRIFCISLSRLEVQDKNLLFDEIFLCIHCLFFYLKELCHEIQPN